MGTLGHDLRIAWRQARMRPFFTAAIVLTLGLGIGVNTAIFSVVDGVLLAPLPFDNGERLVHIGYRPEASEQETLRFSVPEYLDIRRDGDSLEGLAEYHSMAYTLLGRGEPARVRTAVVSANFFELLGVHAALGRLFSPADEAPDANPPLVLTHGFWQSRFGSDPSVVGETLTLADHPMTVIGVLPPLPGFPDEDDIFVTTNGCQFRSQARVAENRGLRFVHLFGRLKPGVTTEGARVELDALFRRLWQEYPTSQPEAEAEPLPVVPVREELLGNFGPTALALAGVVGLVLLIACANVANLTLARLINRDREIAVRTAIGAGRGRLIRQLLTESTVLALAGGLLGIALAVAGVRLLIPFAARFTSRAAEIAVDGRVLLFALGISVVAGVLVGASLAIHRNGHDLVEGLKEGGGKATASSSKHRLRNALVVIQVAVSFMLLIGAGLTVRSLLELRKIDPGFVPDRVITGNVALSFNKYHTPLDLASFGRTAQERLEAIPGVEAVALSSDMPLDGQVSSPPIRIEGRAQETGEAEPQAIFHIASERYFEVVGMPILRGRAFQSTDEPLSEAVVVVNEAMAKRFWPDQDALGRRMAVGPGHWRTVVGVVGDVREVALTEAEPGPAFYLAFLQQPTPVMQIFVRTAGEPEALLETVRRTIQQIDPELAVADLQTLEQVYEASLAQPRLTALLFGLFAVLAFVITALGIAGLVAFLVNQRTQEIGIRAALGAGRADVVFLVVRRGVLLVVVGLAGGILGALYATRVLDSLLYGVTTNDPATFVAVSLLVLLVTVLACLVPVRRALRIDPVLALRSE